MSRLYSCAVCGKATPTKRCPSHQLRPRAGRSQREATRQRIAARDNWTCRICGNPIDPTLRFPHPDALHADHIRRVVDGGGDEDANQRATHARCNLTRG